MNELFRARAPNPTVPADPHAEGCLVAPSPQWGRTGLNWGGQIQARPYARPNRTVGPEPPPSIARGLDFPKRRLLARLPEPPPEEPIGPSEPHDQRNQRAEGRRRYIEPGLRRADKKTVHSEVPLPLSVKPYHSADTGPGRVHVGQARAQREKRDRGGAVL